METIVAISNVGLPAALESTAIQCDHCARHLRQFGQSIIRSDLDSRGPRASAIAAIHTTREALAELESMLGAPVELPKEIPNARPARKRKNRS